MKRATMACLVTMTTLAAFAPSAWADDEPDGALGDESTGETLIVQETAESLQSCRAPALWNPLTAFGDARHYFLAPGGDFESGDEDEGGWLLDGGAEIVDGDAGLSLGEADEGALRLPPGASATSPAFCVDLDYPTFRFFAAQLGDRKGAELKVDVVYPALRKNNVREAAKLKMGWSWTLSPDVKLEPQRAGKRAGWRKVAIRFRAGEPRHRGDWRIDNVLVDPRMRG